MSVLDIGPNAMGGIVVGAIVVALSVAAIARPTWLIHALSRDGRKRWTSALYRPSSVRFTATATLLGGLFLIWTGVSVALGVL